ncbi:hypothetical protein AB0I82_04090 [Streptomyces sp. NPDC050315]|uniref:hypothetical protein n=1 Tax=Streptomyces sp. NPDC050315 TaxID=3155039 RepID=UPI00341354D4
MPDVAHMKSVKELWQRSQWIANTLAILFVLAAGITAMGFESLQTRWQVRELLPRLAVGVFAANLSFELITRIIALGNALALGIYGKAASADDVATLLINLLTPGKLGAIYRNVFGLVVVILAAVLLATVIVRITAFAMLVVAAPLLLMCHAHPVTDPLARLWWRALCGCLGAQIAQALALAVAIKVLLNPENINSFGLPTIGGTLNMLILCCVLYLLLKIPAWILRLVLGTSPGRLIWTTVKYVVLVRKLPGVGSSGGFGGRGATGARRGGGGTGRRGGGSGRSGGPRGGGPGRPGSGSPGGRGLGGGTGQSPRPAPGRRAPGGSAAPAGTGGGTPPSPPPAGGPSAGAPPGGRRHPRSTPRPSTSSATQPPFNAEPTRAVPDTGAGGRTSPAATPARPPASLPRPARVPARRIGPADTAPGGSSTPPPVTPSRPTVRPAATGGPRPVRATPPPRVLRPARLDPPLPPPPPPRRHPRRRQP